MRAAHRVLLGFLVARLVFGVAFLASAVARWPVPWYFPLEHRWQLARAVRGLAMDWYGRSILSLLAGATVGGLVYALSGRTAPGRWLLRPGFVVGVAHLGALMLLNDVLFYVFSLVTRHPVPAPLPGWYCPR
ncbi:MAG: hypothetical protein WCJ30_00185 [Deltaproteobacteria bacterium]